MLDTSSALPRVDINLPILDGLALECLSKKGQTAEHVAASEARAALENGNIDEALSILATGCPSALQDQRLVFRMHKQRFVELVKRQSPGASDSQALACAREQLAPLALDAYPEAYLEFKRLLLLLVYGAAPAVAEASPAAVAPTEHSPPRPQQRQVAPPPHAAVLQDEDLRALTSPGACGELAGMVYHTIRMQIGHHEPPLVLLLAYLLRLHLIFRTTGGATTAAHPAAQSAAQALPEQELVDALMPGGVSRDAPALPDEAGPSSFNEAGIQALIHCTGCTRRDACASLKHTRGDAWGALKHELARLRINRPLLDELLREYVTHRGLYAAEDDVSISGAPTCSSSSGRAAEGGEAGAAGQAQAPQSIRQAAHRLFPGRSHSQSPPAKVARCRDGPQLETGTSRLASGAAPPGAQQQGEGVASEEEIEAKVEEEQEEGEDHQAQLQRLIQAGHMSEVQALVTRLDPGFWDAQPRLLFDLWRCRFGQLLEQGDVGGALVLARSQLSPLAQEDPRLQPALKATMALLLPGGGTPSGDSGLLPSLAAVAGSIQAGLQSKLGTRGPRLVKLMQALLSVHRAWTRHERFSDPFQANLKIDALRQLQQQGQAAAAGGAGGAAAPGPGAPAAPPGASLGASSSEGYSSEIESEDHEDDDDSMRLEVDEGSVLQLMAILELPRSAAIDILTQHGGDLEAALNAVLH